MKRSKTRPAKKLVSRRSRYIVRVTVITPDRRTKKDIRQLVQRALDSGVWRGIVTKASTVDEQ